MAWYEFHEEARNEIKIERLATDMGVRYAEACGWMACLWAWVAVHRQTGDVSDMSAAELTRYARCEVDAEKFSTALKQHRLIDRYGHINAWKKRGVKYLLSARSRVQKHRATHPKAKRNSNVSDTLPSNVTETSTVPYRTVTNHKDIKEGGSAAVSAFTQHFTQALKTKTGSADPALVKKAQGVVYAYLKQFPEAWQELTTEVDVLPRGWSPERYVAQVRVMVQQRTHERIKLEAEKVGKTT